MPYHPCYGSPSFLRVVLVPLVACVMITLAFSSCGRVTKFPANPEKHRLLKEQEKWPNEYYFLVQRGVFSRVVGIQPEVLMRSLLSAMEARWPEVERLHTPEALIAYFRTHGLDPIAERIDVTLKKNVRQKPSNPDRQLEAKAIKTGLVSAFYEVKKAQE